MLKVKWIYGKQHKQLVNRFACFSIDTQMQGPYIIMLFETFPLEPKFTIEHLMLRDVAIVEQFNVTSFL